MMWRTRSVAEATAYGGEARRDHISDRDELKTGARSSGIKQLFKRGDRPDTTSKPSFMIRKKLGRSGQNVAGGRKWCRTHGTR